MMSDRYGGGNRKGRRCSVVGSLAAARVAAAEGSLAGRPHRRRGCGRLADCTGGAHNVVAVMAAYREDRSFIGCYGGSRMRLVLEAIRELLFRKATPWLWPWAPDGERRRAIEGRQLRLRSTAPLVHGLSEGKPAKWNARRSQPTVTTSSHKKAHQGNWVSS